MQRTHFHAFALSADPSSMIPLCKREIRSIYSCCCGPRPVTTTSNLGSAFAPMPSNTILSRSRAAFSYSLSARSNNPKSSSGVHEVDETTKAGRSERNSGEASECVESGLMEVEPSGELALGVDGKGDPSVEGICVNGVENGVDDGGRYPRSEVCSLKTRSRLIKS
jgi:hypothetical protein